MLKAAEHSLLNLPLNDLLKNTTSKSHWFYMSRSRTTKHSNYISWRFFRVNVVLYVIILMMLDYLYDLGYNLDIFESHTHTYCICTQTYNQPGKPDYIISSGNCMYSCIISCMCLLSCSKLPQARLNTRVCGCFLDHLVVHNLLAVDLWTSPTMQ